jgi:hypothetical protein
MSNLEPQDISKEEWHEYSFEGQICRINSPKTLYVGTTTHRVVDATGIVTVCPAPGYHGCVLRWLPRDAADPVQF